MTLSTFRRFLAVTAVALAAILVLGPSTAQSSRESAPLRTIPAPAANLDALREKAEAAGSVNIIVTLQVDRPGRMAFSTMSEASQAAVIAQTQDALLGELDIARSTSSVRRYTNLPMLALQVTAEQLETLEQSGLVAAVQENSFRVLSLDIATANIGMTGTEGAWASGADGTGQVIAVLDSGILKSHTFLTNKVITEACFSTNAPDTPGDGFGAAVTSLCPGMATSSFAIGSAEPCTVAGGECSHGTHIAGIAAGKGSGFSGVAKEANLISIQVFSKITDDGDPGTPPICVRVGYPFVECILAADGDILAAMDYVYSIRNNDTILQGKKIAAVNLSFGNELYTSQAACDTSPAGPAYKAAVTQLVNAGIAVVSSSGNQGRTDSMNLPACITGVISVGATCDGQYNIDADPDPDCNVNTIAPFTNSTPFLSFMAPGVNISSADATNSTGFTSATGTSQATPFVSGAIAAIRSYRPGASLNQIKTALYDSGVTVSDIGGIFKKIQVDAALDQLIFPDQPILLTPEANDAFAETPITFKWTGGEFTTKYTLEIFSSGGTFLTKVNVLHDTCAPDAEFPEEDLVCTADITYDFVDDKTYQWKVTAKYDENNTKTASELRPFQFDTPGRATLLTPENKVTIFQPEELFEFTWEEVNLATSYRLTLYDKKNGSVKINTPQLDEGAICTGGICTYTTTPDDIDDLVDDKKYKWYVTSISDDGTSKSTERLIKTKFPAAPLLTSPADGFLFTSLGDIELTWTEVAAASSYRLRITDTGNNKVVIDETLTVGARTISCLSGTCTFLPSPVQQEKFKNKRTYSWAVTAANDLGDNTSAALTFKTKFPAPPVLIAPLDGLTFDDPAITFTFTEIADADSYELFVIQKSNGSQAFKRNLTPGVNLTCNGSDCSYTLDVTDQSKLKNGKTYQWYAKSVSTAGKSKSETREFTLQSPLPPGLISPDGGTTVFSPAEVIFSWNDVGTGATYSLRIRDEKSGDTVVKANVPPGNCVATTCTYGLTSGEISKLKNNHDYKWWIVATNTVGKSSSPKRAFRTEFPRNPIGITPAANAVLTDRADLTVFEWVSGGTAAPVTYVLKAKRKDNGAVLVNETFPDGAGLTCGADMCSYAVPQPVRDDLSNNKTYKWWVVATSPYGTQTASKLKFKTQFP